MALGWWDEVEAYDLESIISFLQFRSKYILMVAVDMVQILRSC